MPIPKLQETKFNKRAGKETRVIRVYKTKRGYHMFFMVQDGMLRTLANPYFYWAYAEASPKWPSLINFYSRISGGAI